MTRLALDFLWHLRESVDLGSAGPNEETLDRLTRLLERQRVTVSERSGHALAFDASWLRDQPLWPPWLAMGPYDRGRFWIEEGPAGRKLRYDLRSLHLIIFCLFGATLLCLFGFAGGFRWALMVWGLTFGWLYGGNIALAFVRMPSLIRVAIRSSQAD